jgi:hypothetical protein
MFLIGIGAALLVALWIRARIYRNRFSRAMRAIERGAALGRVRAFFWKVAAAGTLLLIAWLFVKTHAH